MLKGCHCLLSKWKLIKHNLTRDILLLVKYKMKHKNGIKDIHLNFWPIKVILRNLIVKNRETLREREREQRKQVHQLKCTKVKTKG